MADDRKRIVPTAGTLGTRLADALAARGVPVSPAAAPVPTPPRPPTPTDVDLSRVAKVVLRRERKGRGGKTATVVAGLGLAARDLERVTRELKRGLGCGAAVDSDTIVLQGDLVARAEPWLAARGVRKIVVGN
jgi:translation initiation factor 1